MKWNPPSQEETWKLYQTQMRRQNSNVKNRYKNLPGSSITAELSGLAANKQIKGLLYTVTGLYDV